MRALHCLYLLLVVGLSACARVEPARNAADLRRNLELAPGLEIYAPAGELLDRCRIVSSWGTEFDTNVLEVGATGDSSRARILLGTRKTPGMEALANRVGITLGQGGFGYRDRGYSESGDAAIFTLEDPERAGLPLTVFLGHDEAGLARILVDLTPCAAPGLRIFQQGRASWEAETDLQGEVEAATLVKLDDAYSGFSRGEMQYERRASRVNLAASTEVDAERFRIYSESVERVAQRVSSWFADSEELPELEVRVHSRVEDFVALHGEARQFAVNRVTGEVAVLMERDTADDSGAGIALGRALQLAGPASELWLEHGVSVDAAGAWWGRELGEWCAHLVSANGSLAVEQLTSPNAAAMQSQHRVRPLQAMLCRYLRFLHGAEGLRDVWAGKLEFSPRTEEFEAWLATELEGVEPLPTRIGKPSFMRGVCLLESETASHGSDVTTRSLSDLGRFGADTIALSTFMTLLREPSDFAPLRRRTAIRATCGDLALAATIAEAQRAELRVLLTPHWLSSVSGSWVGAQVRSSEEEWKHFFQQRATRLVDHFALLGELCEIDVLSLGSELAETSRTLVDEEHTEYAESKKWMREGWARNIQTARASFRGALTYCAAWPTEAGLVEFWKDLDFVSCSLYSEFLKSPSDLETPPGRQQILQATRSRVARMLEIAGGAGKPLLVGEFGLPSTSLAWRRPLSAQGEADAETHARILHSMISAFGEMRQESEALQGVFLWQWWTDPAADGDAGTGYTPQNKLAQRALRDVFSKL